MIRKKAVFCSSYRNRLFILEKDCHSIQFFSFEWQGSQENMPLGKDFGLSGRRDGFSDSKYCHSRAFSDPVAKTVDNPATRFDFIFRWQFDFPIKVYCGEIPAADAHSASEWQKSA
ncbi:hypothetical protein [Salisediminibacterium beveridgei]|uniref:hypothetical protein n=1 Tax=Salisediminibacterium beveridgei TaxID=632773 RepID=UPI0018DE4391|nr:hypothetical protein [Salisediminibacterium beveridgei]